MFPRHQFVRRCLTGCCLLIFIYSFYSCWDRTRSGGSSPKEVVKEEVATEEDMATAALEISMSQQGGPFLILGPNPGGIWAPNYKEGYWWNTMEVTIHNQCNQAFYVDPMSFHLYAASRPDTHMVPFYIPTQLGMEYQVNPLRAGWLQPGEQVTGNLTFEIPETLFDGSASNGAYKTLRLGSDPGMENCSTAYGPY